MTEVVVGIEQLLFLLKKEGIEYTKKDPSDSEYYGTIETPNGIMTWRRLQ